MIREWVRLTPGEAAFLDSDHTGEWAMLRFGKLSLGILLGAFAGFLADAARADNVDLLSFNNISWDIGSSPTASPPVTISIQNMTAGSANAIFNGYDLEFNFTSTAGTGAVVLGSVANPTANAVISNFLTPPTTSGNYVGNTSSAGSTNYVVPSTGATNLVTVTFAYSGSGAFPAVGSTIGVFADRKVSDYLDFNGNTTAYANNLATDAQTSRSARSQLRRSRARSRCSVSVPS